MPNYLEAPKRNALLGLLSDAAGRVNAFAQTPDPTMPMGKANPLLSLLSEFAGVPAVQRTLDRLSYGEPITNAGKANVPLIPADTADAAMALAPIAQIAGKYTGKAANSIADASVRAITRNPQATAASVLDYAAQMRPATPATVWHGSPHKFDAFDSSKIGTGEGAQAYGHGLYLAESPEVAGSYLKASNGPGASLPDWAYITVDGVPLASLTRGMDPSVTGHIASALTASGGNVHDAARAFKALSSGHESSPVVKSVLSVLESGKTADLSKIPSGSLYKVDLPDEKIARMLDWDKPLSQQSPEVQKALSRLDPDMYHPDGGDYDPTELGQMIYQRLSQKGQNEAAQSMRTSGIPGIRYLDGGSRGAGGGTSNFVVFPGEENALTILERNGKPVR